MHTSQQYLTGVMHSTSMHKMLVVVVCIICILARNMHGKKTFTFRSNFYLAPFHYKLFLTPRTTTTTTTTILLQLLIVVLLLYQYNAQLLASSTTILVIVCSLICIVLVVLSSISSSIMQTVYNIICILQSSMHTTRVQLLLVAYQHVCMHPYIIYQLVFEVGGGYLLASSPLMYLEFLSTRIS